MVLDPPMPEQAREQSERMVGQYLVHERLLPFQRLDGATARLSFVL
jgi:hypothetical protein